MTTGGLGLTDRDLFSHSLDTSCPGHLLKNTRREHYPPSIWDALLQGRKSAYAANRKSQGSQSSKGREVERSCVKERLVNTQRSSRLAILRGAASDGLQGGLGEAGRLSKTC